MMTYKNPFHTPKADNSQPEYTAEKWIDYNGHQIVERVKGSVWDVIWNGEIISMRAGLNGAKKYIDTERKFVLI
jgi:hypothetical protein